MPPPNQARRALVIAAVAGTFVAPMQSAWAQAAAPVRLRGTIETLGNDRLVLRQRGGDLVELGLPSNLVVTEAFPVAFSDIKPNSFVGSGAVPQPDGTQRAIAVLLFPESMRGTGEGHRPFDFLPQSTMTNATVAGVVAAPQGQQLRVAYPGGEQTIAVPADTPIYSLKPGARDLLVPGAQVTVTSQLVDGKPTATRITAGRNGFATPY